MIFQLHLITLLNCPRKIYLKAELNFHSQSRDYIFQFVSDNTVLVFGFHSSVNSKVLRRLIILYCLYGGIGTGLSFHADFTCLFVCLFLSLSGFSMSYAQIEYVSK